MSVARRRLLVSARCNLLSEGFAFRPACAIESSFSYRVTAMLLDSNSDCSIGLVIAQVYSGELLSQDAIHFDVFLKANSAHALAMHSSQVKVATDAGLIIHSLIHLYTESKPQVPLLVQIPNLTELIQTPDVQCRCEQRSKQCLLAW